MRFTNRIITVAVLFITLFWIQQAWAASGVISGRVVDAATGEGLPGAAVMVVGTDLGTATDSQGYFTLHLQNAAPVQLLVQMIGYKTVRTEFIRAGSRGILLKLPTSPIPFDGVVVTALRESQMRSDLSQPTDLVRVRQLEAEGWLNLGEALSHQANLFIKEYGDFTAPKTVSIRGSSEGQVLVLLDGNRLNLPQGGGVDFTTLPLGGLRRIEISRGASSALYGSDAVAGVVNLIPSGASGRNLRAGLKSMMGSFGLQQVAVYGSQRVGKVGYWLSASRLKSQGNYRYQKPDGQEAVRLNNDYSGLQLLAGTTYRLNAAGKLSLLVHAFQKDQGDPGMIGYETRTARKKEQRRFFSLRYTQRFRNGLLWSGSLFQNAFDQRYREPAYGVRSKHLNRVAGAQTQLSWSRGNDLSFLVGYEYRHDGLNSSDVGRKGLDLNALYAQARFGFASIGKGAGTYAKVRRLFLIPALRIDRYSGRTAELTPRLGLVYSAVEKGKITLRGNVGRAFRMPSFFDLYWPEGPWAAGNPRLKPEIGLTYDGGALWQIPLARTQTGELRQFLVLELTYFVNNMRDLIVWGPDSGGKWRPQNVAQAEIRGIEAQAEWTLAPAGLSFQIAHTYMKAENTTVGSPYYHKMLIYRPRNKTDLRLRLQRKWLSFSAVYRRVGRRAITEDNRKSLPAFSTLDLSAEIRLHLAGLTIPLRLAAINVLDARYEMISGYPVPGRQFRLGFGLQE